MVIIKRRNPPCISHPRPHHPERLLTFLPEACLEDDTRMDAHAPTRCRGLGMTLWLGAAGVSAAAHFDLQHNLVLQACY